LPVLGQVERCAADEAPRKSLISFRVTTDSAVARRLLSHQPARARGSDMDTSAIDQVVEEMSAPLRRKLEAVRELLAAATADEVRGRHGVGVLILEVKTDENRYGKGAVAKLANSIGVDATTLYRYAAVAKVWDAPTVRSLLRRKGPHGQPASWCHLMELVRVPSASCRKKLLERVLVEGLSVRALVGLVREAGGEHEADDAETESGSAGIVRDLAKLARIAQTRPYSESRASRTTHPAK
jgi:hypothetical protein